MSVEVDQYLEKLDSTHIVLFHEGGKETKDTEYGFIKKGLDKNEHCFYTTQHPEKILSEMKERQIIEKEKTIRITDKGMKFHQDYSKINELILDVSKHIRVE